jgi:hypothetical protein
MRIGHQQVLGSHDHAGDAEAALNRTRVDERLLEPVETSTGRKPLDRDDVGALRFHRQHEAGRHRPAVEQHRARAAFPFAAALLRAGQAHLIPQRFEQRMVRSDVERVPPPIDGQRDRNGGGGHDGYASDCARRSRPMAASSARRLITDSIATR